MTVVGSAPPTVGRDTAGVDAHLGDLAPLDAMYSWFWHPLTTLAELEAAGGVKASRLLGLDLVVGLLGPGEAAVMIDRCPHRSTRLSVGCIDRRALRCAYHGWRWDGHGRCVEIPSVPDQPIPSRFGQVAFAAEIRHGLVWTCLRRDSPTTIPVMPAATDDSMHIVGGQPYVWPTGAGRRVENFVDLAHFAWVHDGTLGTRSAPVPPEVEMHREVSELRFEYQPPPMADIEETALVGRSRYRMPMPLTVNIEFAIAGRPGSVRHLWMTAAPVDPGVCRSYWAVARNDDHDRPDSEFLDFQQVVLDEDLPVVCNQVPPEIPLEMGDELHTKADRVSLEYRRWLRELCDAAARGGAALAGALAVDRPPPTVADRDPATTGVTGARSPAPGAVR